jgi:hypothetical protein
MATITKLPNDGAAVTATCGCAGLVDRTSKTHGGYVRVYVLNPCTDGPHERWSERCKVTFAASQIRVVVADIPQEPDPEPEPEPVQLAYDDRPQPALFPALTPAA